MRTCNKADDARKFSAVLLVLNRYCCAVLLLLLLLLYSTRENRLNSIKSGREGQAASSLHLIDLRQRYGDMMMTITNSQLFLFCVCAVVLLPFGGCLPVPPIDPPEIIQKPHDVAVRSGGVAAFYCRARGEPTPTISWRKNGRKV